MEGDIGVHRAAEAVRERFVVETDDDGVAAAGEIVGVGVDAFDHHLIQFAQGVDIAGAHADDNTRVDGVLDVLLPVRILEVKSRQVFPEGQEKILGGEVRAGVVHLELVEVIQLEEAVDLIPIAVAVAPLGTDDLIVLHQTFDHVAEPALGDRSI